MAKLPETMFAFQMVDYSLEAKIACRLSHSLPLPQPKAGEVLVKVGASGMNFGDTFMGRGGVRALLALPLPVTIGRDVAGVVVAEGAEDASKAQNGSQQGAARLAVGDRVVGYVPVGGGRGTFAQYCIVPRQHCVALPASIPFPYAAALPTAGCTTYQALVGRGVLRKGAGQKILILGGSSGTGVYAIQLAKAYGCSVIATTSSQVDLCTSLGATRVINHRAGQDWGAELKGQDFDIVYDCAEGRSAWKKAPAVLKRSGAQFVTLVGDKPGETITIGDTLAFLCRFATRSFWSLFGYPKYVWHINSGSTQGLAELVALMKEGAARAPLDGDKVHPATWEGFQEMWDRQMSGRAHGKLVMEWQA